MIDGKVTPEDVVFGMRSQLLELALAQAATANAFSPGSTSSSRHPLVSSNPSRPLRPAGFVAIYWRCREIG